jgi:hypothetical protein
VNPNWDAWYRALKQRDPGAYRKAIGYSEAMALNFKWPIKQAAECETHRLNSTTIFMEQSCRS